MLVHFSVLFFDVLIEVVKKYAEANLISLLCCRRLCVSVLDNSKYSLRFQRINSFHAAIFQYFLSSSSFSPSHSLSFVIFSFSFWFNHFRFRSDVNRYAEHEYHEITPQISHAVQEIRPIDTNAYGSDTAIGVGGVGVVNSSSSSSIQQQQSSSFPGNHSYDILPPGVDREPPPPGFENEVIWSDYRCFSHHSNCIEEMMNLIWK